MEQNRKRTISLPGYLIWATYLDLHLIRLFQINGFSKYQLKSGQAWKKSFMRNITFF